MTDAPAFDFYPERWLAGVADMKDRDQLAYIRLLCHAWIRDGLPDDQQSLSRLAGGRVSAAVLDKFPLHEDGKRRNKRLETVRVAQRERIEKARASANARWSKKPCERNANASSKHMRTHPPSICETDAARSIFSPLTTHQSPIDNTNPESCTTRSQAEEGPSVGTGGIPPVTIEQAKQHGPSMGVIPEASEQWWLDNDARGWVDRSGQPVRNWRSSLTAYGRRWEANRARNGNATIPAKKDTDLF